MWDGSARLVGCTLTVFIERGYMEIKLKEVLSRELKKRDESVNALARSCRVPQSTLHNWMQGMLPTAKNLHLLKNLSDYLKVPLATLLFDVKDENFDHDILYSTTFVDAERRYRLIIEKMPK